MLGSLSAKLEVLSVKIETKYLTKNYNLSQIIPLSSMVLSTAILVEAINDDIKLHPSARKSVKVANLMYSMEYTTSEVFPARFVSKSTALKQQSVSKSCLIDQQGNEICRPKGHMEGCCTFASPRLLNRPPRSGL